jgi:hypothetical protein
MRYCGRDFAPTEIDLIRELLNLSRINRSRLSREVCERLDWRRDNGGLKDMSCRVALLRMQADGLITLPPPRNPKPVAYRAHRRRTRLRRERLENQAARPAHWLDERAASAQLASDRQ